ncbi:hypothetical protein M5689_014548 [Euphorbia peplus]|nr:hypothetical protein M5689_014548 [Euphorbia peplus]
MTFNTIPPKKRKIFLDHQQPDLPPPQVLMDDYMNTPSPPLPTASTSPSTSPEEKINFDNEDEAYLDKAITFCNEVRDYLCNNEEQLQFMKILHYYGIQTIDKVDMRKMISQLLENHPNLMNEFDKLIDHYSNPTQVDSGEKKKTEKQIILEPVGEEVNNANPSYHRQPTSKRKICESDVLNDEWILNTPNVMSIEKERNAYEKIMIRCEDDRYEFDMALSYLKSAFANVKKFINAIMENEELDAPIKAERYLSVQNLRCIEELYGEHSEYIFHLLAGNPNRTLIVVLIRLNQKIEEFENDYKSGFKQQLAKAYADNLHKSMGFE